jgi:hypothetical protein
MVLGQKNVAHRALVNKKKIYLPPLHLKLELTNIHVKATNKEGEGFGYLRQKFPLKSETKIKEGIFVGPQVKQLFQHPDLKN